MHFHQCFQLVDPFGLEAKVVHKLKNMSFLHFIDNSIEAIVTLLLFWAEKLCSLARVGVERSSRSNSLSVGLSRDFLQKRMIAALTIHDWGTVSSLLREGGAATVSVPVSPMRMQPVHLAAIHAPAHICSILIANEANVNVPDMCGWTALHYAASSGNEGSAGVLLASGAKIEVAGNNGYSPLMIATLRGHCVVAEQLIDAGAKMSGCFEPINGDSPLILAVRQGRRDMVLLLLRRGALINERNQKNVDTVLMTAAEEGTNTVDLLLQHGADIHATRLLVRPDGGRSTALIIAVSCCNMAVAELLVAYGADPEQKVLQISALDVLDAKLGAHAARIPGISERRRADMEVFRTRLLYVRRQFLSNNESQDVALAAATEKSIPQHVD